MTDEMSFFNKDGYIYLSNFLSPKELLSDALGVFKNVLNCENNLNKIENGMMHLFFDNFDAFVNCGKTCQGLISLYKMSCSSIILNKLFDLNIKTPSISTRPVLFFNHPNLAKKEVYYKTPAHQDWRSIQGSLNSVVVWIPLVDVPYELGPLEVIPGSHLRGLCSDKIEDNFGVCSNVDNDEFISIPIKAGDALIFSTFLIHRSGNNISNKIRWSCHFRYNDLQEDTFIKRGYPSPYIYKPEPNLITPNFPTINQIKNVYNK